MIKRFAVVDANGDQVVELSGTQFPWHGPLSIVVQEEEPENVEPEVPLAELFRPGTEFVDKDGDKCVSFGVVDGEVFYRYFGSHTQVWIADSRMENDVRKDFTITKPAPAYTLAERVNLGPHREVRRKSDGEVYVLRAIDSPGGWVRLTDNRPFGAQTVAIIDFDRDFEPAWEEA